MKIVNLKCFQFLFFNSFFPFSNKNYSLTKCTNFMSKTVIELGAAAKLKKKKEKKTRKTKPSKLSKKQLQQQLKRHTCIQNLYSTRGIHWHLDAAEQIFVIHCCHTLVPSLFLVFFFVHLTTQKFLYFNKTCWSGVLFILVYSTDERERNIQ